MTPRELALCAEGYRARDRHDWQKRAVEIAYHLTPWGSKATPQEILDQILGVGDEGKFEQLAGLADPEESLKIMLQRQAERRASSTSKP